MACHDDLAAAMGALSIGDEEKKTGDDDGSALQQRRSLDEQFETVSREKLKTLELVEMPVQLANVELYHHQVQGISWLVQSENRKGNPAWWKQNDDGKYQCSVTGRQKRRKPPTCYGCILADGMGLGKTLQAVGLMLLKPGLTLIVCPVSVMANWKFQLTEYAPHLQSVFYYGSDRFKTLEDLGTVDVLITSYQTLVADYQQYLEHQAKIQDNEDRKQQGKRLLKLSPRKFCVDVPFYRVILDEAHEIRNPSTWFFKSCCALDTQYKLCLTGTPFVNRPQDIGSLLTFLGAYPLSDPEYFDKKVLIPIKKRREVGLARLRTMMAHLSLRRNKDIIASTVPSKSVQIVSVELTDGSHKDVLTVFHETTRSCIIGLFQLGSAGRKLGAIFGLLLRVRQACCDLRLVPARRRLIVDGVAEKMQEVQDLTSDQGVELLQKLIGDLDQARVEDELESGAESSEDEKEFHSGSEVEDSSREESEEEEGEAPEFDKCENCDELLNEDTAVVITSCGHVFCEECLDPESGRICPQCRQPYRMGDLSRELSSATPYKTPTKKPQRQFIVPETMVIDFDEDTERSPKVQALLDAIEEMESDEKAVIFSQWTSFLDIIRDEFDDVGHSYARIDGSMSADQRLQSMQKFGKQKCGDSNSPRFVLCSLRACGTGINLTRGNVVFLMDPYWNAASEEQAMDRVHRIGQKRPVRVIRFVMKGTIEEKMIDLQNAKSALGKGSMDKISPQERSLARLTFLRDLFDIGEQEVSWDTDGDFLLDEEDDENTWEDGTDEPWV